MPPVRFTIESFEDVTGYPGKIFYVLHQYPGTGCPQVPFLAIDKNKKGGFSLRELEQRPLETFEENKYKFQWPRDPRLQARINEAEEVMKIEISSPALENPQPKPVVKDVQERIQSVPLAQDEERTEPMPIIQDVKSISMEVFQEIKYTQASSTTKHGSSERSGTRTVREDSKPIVQRDSLPISSRVTKETTVSDNVGTSGTALPVSMVGRKASVHNTSQSESSTSSELPNLSDNVLAKSETSKAPSTAIEIDGAPSKKNETQIPLHSKIELATVIKKTSKDLLAAISNIVAPKKTGTTIPSDSKVELSTPINTSLVNDNASSSKTHIPDVVGGGFEYTKTVSKVSVDCKIQVLQSQNSSILVTQNLPGNSELSSLVADECSVEHRKGRGGVLVDTKVNTKSVSSKVGDAISKSRSSVIQSSSAPTASGEESRPKVESSASGSHKYSGKSHLQPCSDDATAPSSDNSLSKPSSAKSNVERSTEKNLQKTQLDTVSRGDGGAEVSSSAKSNPHKTVNEEISGTSSERAKSGNQSTSTESTKQTTVKSTISFSGTSDIEALCKSQKTTEEKDTSSAKSDSEDSTSEMKTLVKDISTMVSEYMEVYRSDPEKFKEYREVKDCPGVVFGSMDKYRNDPEKLSEYRRVKDISNMVHGYMEMYRNDPVKFKEVTDGSQKDQAVDSKDPSNNTKEIHCLPKTVQKDLSIVDNLINRSKSFVKQNKTRFLDKIPERYEKFFPEPGCRVKEGVSKDRVKKSKSIDQADDQKSEKIHRKSITSASKSIDSGDKISNDDNPSPKASESVVVSTTIVHQSIASQVRFKTSMVVAKCSSLESTSAKDVNQFHSDEGPESQGNTTMKKRRNTVDGSEDSAKAKPRRVSSKIRPYDLQKYRKELDKYRPTKKLAPKTNSSEARNSVETPNDDGQSTGVSSCPGSPVSKNMKSSIEDIFNLQAILTDESSQCNYSDITLKGPVQVASNASLDKPVGSPQANHSEKPSLTEKSPKKIEEKKTSGTANKATLDSIKSSAEDVVISCNDTLSNYAEVSSLKTPKLSGEEHKKKERKGKCEALFKERNQAPEVNKGNLKASANFGGSSNCPPTIGMHKLPAIVSSLRTQSKPIVLRKLCSKVKSRSNSAVEVEQEHDKTSNANKQSEKESSVEESSRTSKDKGAVKSREAQEEKRKFEVERGHKKPANSEKLIQKESAVEETPTTPKKVLDAVKGREAQAEKNDGKVEKRSSEDSQLTKSAKVQLALKRQKRLESPPSSSPEKKGVSKPSNTDSSLDKNAVTATLTDVVSHSEASTIGDPEPLIDTVKKDAKKDVSTKSRSNSKTSSKADSKEKGVAKSKSETSKGSPKHEVVRKDSTNTSGNKHDKISKIPGSNSKEVSSVPTVSPVDSSSAINNEKPQTLTSANDVTPTSSSPKVSSLRSEFISELTEPLPTTETRKQLLLQLASEITENKALNPPEEVQKGVLGLVSIGSDDLIQDKILGVVEGIVKIKVEMSESLNKKKNAPLEPPTEEELGEFFSEIFYNDTPPIEEDESAVRSNADSVGKSATASTQACSPDLASDTNSVNPTTEKKSETVLQADNLKVGRKENDSLGSKEKPTAGSVNASNDSTLSPVSKSQTFSTVSGTSHDVEVSKEPGADVPSITSETAENTVDKNNKNTDLIAQPLSSSEGPVPDADSPYEISSQESVVEIVDVDDNASSSQKMPQPFLLPNPEMPRPIISLNSRPTTDDVVITDVTSSITGESLLNSGTNNGGGQRKSSNKRSSDVDSEAPSRKRLCAIPAPILFPTSPIVLRPISSTSEIRFRPRQGLVRYGARYIRFSGRTPTLEPAMPLPLPMPLPMPKPIVEPSPLPVSMPQPIMEFRNSPTLSDPITPKLPSSEAPIEQDKDQDTSQSSTTTPQAPRTNLSEKLQSAPSTSQGDDGTKTRHEKLSVQSVGSSNDSPQGDVKGIPSSSGGMEVKRSSEENKVGLLTPQESLSRRNGSISGKKSARQPQFKTRRKRPLLNIIKNKGGNDASSQRSRSENSRVPGRERDVFVRGRHSSSSQYQEATGSEFYNDAVIDRRRHQGDNIFHHYRHQSEHAEMGATQFQEALQSQSRRGGMEESYGRRPPFLGEASQEVLSHRGERFRRPPLLEDPPIPRQAVNQWEQGPRNYCNIGQEIKVIESPFPRDSRRPQPARTSSTINIERINDIRRSPWASEGTPEETRRWTFPFAAQHRPQEPQRSHQERRLLTPRRHLEDERCRRLS